MANNLPSGPMSVGPNQTPVTPGGGKTALPSVSSGPMSVGPEKAPAVRKPAPEKPKATPPPPPPAQFTDKQVSELNTAALRRSRGQATETDLKNLQYAESKGYSYQLNEKQVEELDAASAREGGLTEKDVQNINYAKNLGYTPPPAPPPVISQEEKKEIQSYKSEPDITSGAVTSEDTNRISDVITSVIDRTEANPLPTITDVFAVGSQAVELPPELQTIQTEIETLAKSITPESLEETGGYLEPVFQELADSLEKRKVEEEQLTKEKYDLQMEDQKILNQNAVKALTSRLNKFGIADTNVGLGLIHSTISQGERTLREISLLERQELRELQNNYEDGKFTLALQNIEMIDKRRSDYLNLSTQLFSLKTQYQDQILKINEMKRTLARETVDDLVAAGYAPEDVPDYVSDAVDKELGRPKGFTKQILTLADSERKKQAVLDAAALEKQSVENALSLVGLFDTLGATGKVTIGGNEYIYEGKNLSGIQSGLQISKNGDGIYWEVDARTGEHRAIKIGNFGSQENTVIEKDDAGNLWSIDPAADNKMTLLSPTAAAKDWSSVFPEGESWYNPDVRDANNEYVGQCGQFVNDLYGEKLIPSEYEGKVSAMEEYGMVAGEKNLANIKIRDTFLQDIGTYGHVGIVEGKGTDKNGRDYIVAMEQNYNGKGTVSHGRIIYLDDASLIGIASIPTPSLPETGPDTTQAGFGVFGGQAETTAILSQNVMAVVSGALTLKDVPQNMRAQTAIQAMNMGWKPALETSEAWGSLDLRQQAEGLGILKRLPAKLGADDDIKGMVANMMLQGMTPDEVEDIILYSQHSEAFTGVWEDAARSVQRAAKMGDAQGEDFLNEVDRRVSDGDFQGAKEYLRTVAITGMPSEMAQKTQGRIATLDLITQIENDIYAYEQAGGKTNIFNGSVENLYNVAGQIKEPKQRELAQKIAIAVQQYRQSISGAAFTESETKEYQNVFPDIKNVAELNYIKIKALRDVFNARVDSDLSLYIGQGAYQTLFKTERKEPPPFSPNLSTPPTGEVWVWDTVSGQYGSVPKKEASNPQYVRI